MRPHEERVVAEKAELDTKLEKLRAFVNSRAFESVAIAERERLQTQVFAMEAYSAVLGERIEAFTPPVGASNLPQWKCHKVVGASRIIRIEPEDSRPGDDALLRLNMLAHAPVHVKWDWLAKHEPKVGGYYVEYEDGYTSFSPAEAFEKGYTPL